MERDHIRFTLHSVRTLIYYNSALSSSSSHSPSTVTWASKLEKSSFMNSSRWCLHDLLWSDDLWLLLHNNISAYGGKNWVLQTKWLEKWICSIQVETIQSRETNKPLLMMFDSESVISAALMLHVSRSNTGLSLFKSWICKLTYFIRYIALTVI